jgi:hypothetical protein
LLRNYREKWASFAYFEGTGGGISLQLRLAGGESGIRSHARIENKGSPLFSVLPFLNFRTSRRPNTDLAQKAVPAASSRTVNQDHEIVTENLAQNFVDHCSIRLAANRVSELPFHHRERGFNVAAFVVVG